MPAKFEGKNDARTAIKQFYTPPPAKKTYTPKQIPGYAPDRVLCTRDPRLSIKA